MAKAPVDIITSSKFVDYNKAVSFMENSVKDIYDNNDNSKIWLLEHPSLYTAGTSANKEDLLDNTLPVFQTGRGGQYTYHGPGQRVVYLMLNIKQLYSKPDIKRFIYDIEECIINILKYLGIEGQRREGRVGIWTIQNNIEAKIAAIGIRVKKWVSYHGIALNLNPDLSLFKGIIPCGIKDYGVTSIYNHSKNITLKQLDELVKQEFVKQFKLDIRSEYEI